MKPVILVIAMVLLSLTTQAEVTPKHKQLATEIVAASFEEKDLMSMLESTMSLTVEKVPGGVSKEWVAAFKEAMKVKGLPYLRELMVEAYTEVYTEEELDSLVKFLRANPWFHAKGPVFLEKMYPIAIKVGEIMGAYAMNKVGKIN